MKLQSKTSIQTYILCFLFLGLFACNKCPEGVTDTYYIIQTDLDNILSPYCDSCKVKFIKNGTDTLTYSSSGVSKDFIDEYVGAGGCSELYRIERKAITMRASESEYFKITLLNAGLTDLADLNYEINNYDFYKDGSTGFNSRGDLKSEFINEYTINQFKYDTVFKVSTKYGAYLVFKEKVGIIEFKSKNNLYQIIPE